MYPVWLLNLNASQSNSGVVSIKVESLREAAKKVLNFFKLVGDVVFNFFMRPCSVQEQIEAARVAESKLRRHINIM